MRPLRSATPILVRVCIALAAALYAVETAAQTGPVHSDNGFQPNRDYLALQPFEAIDTASGNLVLTFTDLELPGNGGRTLSFTRVYNNVQPSEGSKWRFSISGIPMKVTVGLVQVGQVIENSIYGEGLFNFTMPDGSRLRTTFLTDPITTTQQQVNNTARWLTTPLLWRYDHIARVLYLPDGTVAQYDATGRLQAFYDRFNNAVNLTWTPGNLTVAQALGNGQVRTVVLTMDDAAMFPLQMTFDGKVWTYTPVGGQSGTLASVQPPTGGPWVYEYTLGNMWRVTSPQGGKITYNYDWFSFLVDPVTQSQEPFFTLKYRDIDDLTQTGRWEFSYLISSPQPGGFLAGSRVKLPSNYVVEFGYGPVGGPDALTGGWALTDRTVYATDGTTVIERESRGYIPLEAARPNRVWSTPEIQHRWVTRSGQTFETEYVYSAELNTLRGYHRPTQVIERRPGQVARTTNLYYQHLIALPTYMPGLTTAEIVDAEGDVASRGWSYNSTTGFRESEFVNGITTRFAPDALGNVATVTKANGRVTSFSYSYGQMSQATTPGVVTTRAINPDGTVQSETVAGRTTSYQYDDLGRVTVVEPPSANPINTSYTATSVVTTRDRSRVTTVLDGFGRPIETVNSLGIRTKTKYDAEGRVIRRGLPFIEGQDSGEIWTAIAYDGLGRVTSETNPDGSSRQHTYNGNAVTVTDERGNGTLLTYKAFGHPDDKRLVAVRDANGSDWNYSYNVSGSLTRVDGPTGVSRIWTYDSENLLRQETHPESGTVRYTAYDAAGVLKGKTDANGNQFVYGHDGNDRLTSITVGSQTTTITYEAGSDNRETMTVGNAITQLGYDGAGRLKTRRDTVDGHPLEVQYGYDGNGNVTLVVYPSGRAVGYDYDNENRITRVFNAHANGTDYASGFKYHPSGGLTSYVAGNNIATNINYHPTRYWVSSIDVGPSGSLLHLGYRYDEVGNVASITDSQMGNQTFTYDKLDRLWTVTGGAPGTFIYDAHGNRQDPNYIYKPGNPFRLETFNGITVDYDLNGNLFKGPQENFSYTRGNLMSVAEVGNTKTRFEYDADDLRVKKAVENGATTLYMRGPNGQLLTEILDATTAQPRTRDHVYAGSRLIAVAETTIPALVTVPGGNPGGGSGGGGTTPTPPVSVSNTLLSNTKLLPNQSLQSQDGRFILLYQTDGNLVLYQNSVPTWVPLWSTGTHGRTAGEVVMQGDGNLVVNDASGIAVWDSKTSIYTGAFVTLQDDGNLVIYRSPGLWVWQSFTCCH